MIHINAIIISFVANLIIQTNSTCKEVGQSQVTQQVIDWEVKASVFENGAYHQKIGEDDNEADHHAQTDDNIVPSAPVVTDVLPTGLVEKLDRAVVVAPLCVVIHCIHVEVGICVITEKMKMTLGGETLHTGGRAQGLECHSDSFFQVSGRLACHQLDRWRTEEPSQVFTGMMALFNL